MTPITAATSTATTRPTKAFAQPFRLGGVMSCSTEDRTILDAGLKVSLGHDHPAQNTGSGGKHRGTSRADAIEQRAADKQKDDNLGGHRHRPQHPDRAGADPGGLPADYGETVVHRMTAEDQGRDNYDPAVEREPQQRS